jgi:hypothetical protein
MRRIFGSLIVLIFLLQFTGCLDSSTEPDPVDDPEDNSKQESELLTASADSALIAMVNAGNVGEFDSPDDMLPYAQDIAMLYKDAAAKDPSNSRANFGAAIFGFQSILDDPAMVELQDLITSMEEEFPDGSAPKYVNSYFLGGLSKKAPDDPDMGDPLEGINTLMLFIQNSLSTNDILEFIQDLIDSALIGQLNESISYMNKVHADNDFVFLITPEMTGEIETYEIDLGEVYMFSAMMRAMRANLKIMNAYQLSYGSIEDFDSEALIEMIADQDTNNGSFLTLRDNTTLPSAEQDLIDALTMIENAVDYIKTETDNQDNDLIKQGDLMEADSEISIDMGQDEDNPIPLMRNATGITDLSSKIKTLLSGPFDVEFPGAITVSFDISALLDNGITDIKSLLPLHEWNLDDMDDPIYLVDSQGNRTQMPTFPDPTFGGLLPGMTQQGIEDLMIE